MKHNIMKLALTFTAVAALVMVIGSIASGETGWPINEDDDPENGGNWMGTGHSDIPGGPGGDPPAQHADWYNNTNGDEDWVISSGNNVTRSFSAFDLNHNLIIENGGILYLDSVQLNMNVTEADNQIWVKSGGQLYISNSTLRPAEILVEGELHIVPGNGTNIFQFVQGNDTGIKVKEGSFVEIDSSTLVGYENMIIVEETNIDFHDNIFKTKTKDKAAIHLKVSAEIHDNEFQDGAIGGSYAIIADEGVNSEIYNNTFTRFRYGDDYGHVIKSMGAVEIYDNVFTKMDMEDTNDPYLIIFIDEEPTDHEGDPIWETNRFKGMTSGAGDERVNIFQQLWTTEVTVNNLNTGNPIEGAVVNFTDVNEIQVGQMITDSQGIVVYETPVSYVSASDDGDAGDTPKNLVNQNPYDIEASKEGESATEEDKQIDEPTELTLELDLVEFDYGVTTFSLPDIINAGESSLIEEITIFNNGYNDSTSIDIEIMVNDETLHTEEDVLIDDELKKINVELTVPLSYASQDVVFKAKTIFASDSNNSNDEYVSPSTHINEKPTVSVTDPAQDETVSGEVNITGTASDDIQLTSVWVKPGDNWIQANGAASWYYKLDTSSMTNSVHSIMIRSRDNNGSYSDELVLNLTVENKPLVSIISPADGKDVYGNATVTMVGETQVLDAAIEVVTISIDGGPEQNATTTTEWSQWKFDLKKGDTDHLNTLSDGEHTFTAKVYDESGLENTDTVTYVVHSTNETTAPTILILSGDIEITGNTIVNGFATDDHKVEAVLFKINDGDWKAAQEAPDLGTKNTSYSVRVSPSDFDLESNVLYVMAQDEDENTTTSIGVTVPDVTGVDLSISSIELTDTGGDELSETDLKAGKKIKVKVNVKKTGAANIPVVPVQLKIGGVAADTKNQENVTADFSMTITVTLTNSMSGKKDWVVKVDPADIVSEDNENNNMENGEFNSKIDKQDTGDEEENGDSPGFEFVGLVVGVSAAVLIFSGRRRD